LRQIQAGRAAAKTPRQPQATPAKQKRRADKARLALLSLGEEHKMVEETGKVQNLNALEAIHPQRT
jgi:hypothetical protein